jgi:hypothetical protein
MRRIGLQQGPERGASELPGRKFGTQAEMDQHV